MTIPPCLAMASQAMRAIKPVRHRFFAAIIAIRQAGGQETHFVLDHPLGGGKKGTHGAFAKVLTTRRHRAIGPPVGPNRALA